MGRRENKLKDNVGLYKGKCECGSACTKEYKAYFGVQKCPKIFKENQKKIKRQYFASGSARKLPFSLVFKSVSR